MSGAPSDSYGHGLFRTSSAGNMSRHYKALRRRRAAKVVPPRKVAAPKKPPRSTKRNEVAELLSQGFEFNAIARQMGITPKAVSRHFEAICKRLGSQAR